MSAREIQNTAVAGLFAPPAAPDDAHVSPSPLREHKIQPIEAERSLHPAAGPRLCEPVEKSSLAPADAASFNRILQRLETRAKERAPRIAFKAKGRIIFLDLADIVAVQAEGNYVSLQHRPSPHLLHESLSSMADKLRPYGFIRIHRSVVVNISAVEEIRPLPTGEYKLRVRGGKEYLASRTYKTNLRELAQLWIGSDRLCRP